MTHVPFAKAFSLSSLFSVKLLIINHPNYIVSGSLSFAFASKGRRFLRSQQFVFSNHHHQWLYSPFLGPRFFSL
jgi:hypothetical protein